LGRTALIVGATGAVALRLAERLLADDERAVAEARARIAVLHAGRSEGHVVLAAWGSRQPSYTASRRTIRR
jgi:NAD(P)-dependent dehydrogenase (short-subunit alcohol dehydrogenase family)